MGCAPSKPQAKDIKSPAVHPTKPSRDSTMGSDRTEKSAMGKKATLVSKATLARHISGGLSADYELRETLRYSPYSLLKHAVYAPTGDHRSVKIIQKSVLDADTVNAAGGLREVEALKRLDHPCVIRIVEVHEDKFRVFVVLEEMTGEELLDFLDAKRELAVAHIQSILRQLLTTLQYCHSQGVYLLTIPFESVSLTASSDSVLLRLSDFTTAVFADEPLRKTLKKATITTAPEVLKGEWGPQADLWSCGVILHLILFGRPPYTNPRSSDPLEEVRSGSLAVSDTSQLDPSLRSLLLGLLDKSPKTRLTAPKALASAWFQCPAPSSSSHCSQSIEEMRTYRSAYKLKDAIFTFLSFHNLSSTEANEAKEAFQSLDRNGDGRVSRTELLDYYKERNRETAYEIEDILSQVDSDNSGFIEFSEFLKATLAKRKYLSQQYLSLAFQSFDVDHSGKISVTDLQAIANNSCAEVEELIKAVVEEADFNKDGEIDLTEFQAVALKKF